MSDVSYPTQHFSNGHMIGGLGAPQRPSANFHFVRMDGPASISFSGELSQEAALKLDVFLRDLLAEDAPVMAAARSAQEQIWEAQKLAAHRQQQAIYAQVNPAPRADYGG